MGRFSRTLSPCLLSGLLCVAGVAAAEPQGNAGLTFGGAAVGRDGAVFDHAEFHLGLRGDVIFGRDDAWDFGIGPYGELGTFALDEFQFGAGASFLVPVDDSFPLVASLGPCARIGDDDFGLEPCISSSLFWGTRSYNFHSGYSMAAGLNVGFRHAFGESGESALLIAAQIDLVVLGLPFVALLQLMRGPSADAAPLD